MSTKEARNAFVLLCFRKNRFEKDYLLLVLNYLNKHFTMLKDYPLVLTETKGYFNFVLNDYCQKYSQTLEKITSASQDFQAGLQAGNKSKVKWL